MKKVILSLAVLATVAMAAGDIDHPHDRIAEKKKKSKEDPLAEAAKSATQRFIIGPLNLIVDLTCLPSDPDRQSFGFQAGAIA